MIAKGAYYLANKDRIKRYCLANKDRFKKQSKILREGYYNLKLQIFSLLGGKCKHCGFSDRRALQIDHVNGGGGQEIRTLGTGPKYYNHVLLSISMAENRYQLLCANCNWIKRFENNEHRGLAKRLNKQEVKERTLFDKEFL